MRAEPENQSAVMVHVRTAQTKKNKMRKTIMQEKPEEKEYDAKKKTVIGISQGLGDFD